ncbi:MULTISPECIES: hypothetical protein [unclassified Streptomyces]|uniref:hypothetical protein n=1 Tax=unclassified Streptomyces TaxID=2593676 RepID=UPI000A83CC81|nr:hypothetical protein [Streptomyces sp. CNQ-509]
MSNEDAAEPAVDPTVPRATPSRRSIRASSRWPGIWRPAAKVGAAKPIDAYGAVGRKP